MNQITELVADLREDPVPTTSPTYASGCPFFLSSSNCLIGPTSPSTSGTMPSLASLSIASPWRGMSGRDQASTAGDKSSVLVSPLTKKTVVVIFLGTSGFSRNHSAFAHDCMTSFAPALPALALDSTSWNASKSRIVFLSAFTAAADSSGESSASISVATL